MPSGRSARHDEVADGHLHRLAPLVAGCGAYLDHALIGTRLRRPHLEHLDVEVELVAGAHRQRPAELVEARADDAARRLELAFDQEPHGHRRGMPAARRQAAENRAARRIGVEVEGLRVEFGGEALDARLVDAQPTGAVALAGGQVLEIFASHVAVLLCSVGQVSGPNHAPPATAAALMTPNATSARLCARKTWTRSPLHASASQPTSAAIA